MDADGRGTTETQLLVIGGGPGGYTAAFRAAGLGLRTMIVDERHVLGGAWLHEGCILSKELLHLADTIRAAEHASRFGILFDRPRIDVEAVRAGLHRTVRRFASNLSDLCREYGIEHISGRAAFDSEREVVIRDNPDIERIRFERAIIATGGADCPPDRLSTGGERTMSTAEALALPEIPGALLVVAGRPGALELASVYAALGSRVTVVVDDDQLVPLADVDLVELLREQLTASLEEVCLATRVASLSETETEVRAEFEGRCIPKETSFDRVLIAPARRGCVDGLDLHRTRISLDESGFISVDHQLRTGNPRIQAVGDVIGEPMLALKATHQGRIAAECAAGWGSEFDDRTVPMVLFTDPQIAWCGLTEAEARRQAHPHEVQRTRWAAAGQSTGLHRSEGFTKIIYEPDTQLILGLGIVGPNAAELIAEGALAIQTEAILTDLAATLHPHPAHGEFICEPGHGSNASRAAGGD
ncbi:MAG: NAD(P)/FAD-dependent oxidoreductase [Planctomycetota bacterium]|nr:NAD(P)/FAD-dependent oxidoreductase [Planctomycetota bacterium]